MGQLRYSARLLMLILATGMVACQKISTSPSTAGPAALTVVNAIPDSRYIIPVINTSSAIMYFSNAQLIRYGYSWEYSPSGGSDTVYVVQRNNDTLDIEPKATDLMFYNILNLKPGSIYSLFLTGVDTSTPDYLFTNDSVPNHDSRDSVVGIRFVNLSAGSNPISVNLEGGPNGSEVGNLPYKEITGFMNYICNSAVTTSGYLFVFRDAVTGDSLTSFSLNGIGLGNGIGLVDPTNGNALIFKNVTVALYGSEEPMSNIGLNVMLIDNY